MPEGALFILSKGIINMPKGSRSGHWVNNNGLGNGGGGPQFTGGNVGNFPQKKNPFKPFKTYQKEYENARDLPTLKKLLEDNGVVMSDKFERYIQSGNFKTCFIKEKTTVGSLFLFLFRYNESTIKIAEQNRQVKARHKIIRKE